MIKFAKKYSFKSQLNGESVDEMRANAFKGLAIHRIYKNVFFYMTAHTWRQLTSPYTLSETLQEKA